jgi:hypothetical protein
MTCNAILLAWMGAGRERAFCMGCSWARRTDGDVVATLKETGLPARAGLMRVHLLWRWRLHLHRVDVVVVVVVVVYDWGLGEGLHHHVNVDLLRSHRLRRIRRILLLHVRLCHGHGRWDRKRHLHLKGLARRDPVWHHHLHLLPGAGILHHEGGSRSEARRARHRHRRRRPHLVAQKQADIQLLLHQRSCYWHRRNRAPFLHSVLPLLASFCYGTEYATSTVGPDEGYVHVHVTVTLNCHHGKTHGHRSRGDTTWEAQKLPVREPPLVNQSSHGTTGTVPVQFNV